MSKLMQAVMANFNVKKSYGDMIREKILDPLEKDLKELNSHLQKTQLPYEFELVRNIDTTLGRVTLYRRLEDGETTVRQTVHALYLKYYNDANVQFVHSEAEWIAPNDEVLSKVSDFVTGVIQITLTEKEKVKFKDYLADLITTYVSPQPS